MDAMVARCVDWRKVRTKCKGHGKGGLDAAKLMKATNADRERDSQIGKSALRVLSGEGTALQSAEVFRKRWRVRVRGGVTERREGRMMGGL